MAAQEASQSEPDHAGGTAWLSDEEQEAWRTMVSLHARLVARLDAELQEAHAISLREYEVLAHLSEVEGAALRMAELADRLSVSPSGLTRRLDGLVRDGLVKRQACLSDRRGTLAVLSAAGWATLEDAAPTHAAGVRRYVFDPVDQDQLRQLTSSLRSMRSALESPALESPALKSPPLESPPLESPALGSQAFEWPPLESQALESQAFESPNRSVSGDMPPDPSG